MPCTVQPLLSPASHAYDARPRGQNLHPCQRAAFEASVLQCVGHSARARASAANHAICCAACGSDVLAERAASACRWRIWSADCRANFAHSSTSRSPCRPPARVCTSGASARTRTRAGYQRRPLRDRPRLLQNLKARAQEQERESHVQTSAAALAHGNARRCGGGGRVRVQLAAVSPALRHAIASSASRAAGGESETAIVR